MHKELAIGVDIGGSHISCAAYDLQNKELLENTHAESDVDCHAQPEVIVEAWGKAIARTMELAGAENVVGIGFAMPGPFDYVKGISLFEGQNGKFENTYGLDVPVELRNYLNLSDDFKIRFINDATAFAIGEDQVGMARDFSRSLSVTLGTGFGSAFIKNGLPVVEGDEVPNQGCVWHLPFEDGIADDYFSTRGLVNRFLKSTGIKASGVKEIAQMAQDNAAARDLFNDFGAKMGVLLKPWIKSFEMEEFVMGGNISKAYPLFRESLNDFLAKENLDLNISISELKESASFIGSATLVDDEFYERVLPMLKLM